LAGLVAATLLTGSANGYSPDTESPCLPGYCGAASNEVVTIPDDAPDGVALGPLSLGTTGTITDVAVAVTISHAYSGDVALTLRYDADRDGEIDADAPLDVYLSRPNLCIGEESWSCPVALEGTYVFKDEGWSDAGYEAHLEAFEGLRADGEWYLVVADRGSGDVGTISGWSVYAAAQEDTFTTNVADGNETPASSTHMPGTVPTATSR
jgi:subtilisin-like proprotein convertase family protein